MKITLSVRNSTQIFFAIARVNLHILKNVQQKRIAHLQIYLSIYDLATHYYTPYRPWYMPLHTLFALVHASTNLTKTWYIALHTFYAMVHTTTTLHALLILITFLGSYHYFLGHHYTPYMPWYTPHILVHTTTHLICIGTHHYTYGTPLLCNAQFHPTFCATPPKKKSWALHTAFLQ